MKLVGVFFLAIFCVIVIRGGTSPTGLVLSLFHQVGYNCFATRVWYSSYRSFIIIMICFLIFFSKVLEVRDTKFFFFFFQDEIIQNCACTSTYIRALVIFNRLSNIDPKQELMKLFTQFMSLLRHFDHLFEVNQYSLICLVSAAAKWISRIFSQVNFSACLTPYRWNEDYSKSW